MQIPASVKITIKAMISLVRVNLPKTLISSDLQAALRKKTVLFRIEFKSISHLSFGSMFLIIKKEQDCFPLHYVSKGLAVNYYTV
jgi:hypothetical protein